MNEKGRGVHSRLLFGIDIDIGNSWYGYPSHSPKRQGRASIRWHHMVIVNGKGVGFGWLPCFTGTYHHKPI